MGHGATAFLLGILAFQQMPVLPSAAWGGLIPAWMALAFYLRGFRLPAWFACGFLWTLLHASHVLGIGLAPELEGEDVIIEGTIAAIPERMAGAARIQFDVERLSWRGEDRPVPGRVRLSWYTNPPELNAGERWRLKVRLKRPRGFANPGGFDYEAYLYRQRIRAAGYIREDAQNRRLDAASLAYPLQRLRQGLGEKIAAALAERDLYGVVTALAIGDYQGISREQWDVFRRTGTSHLVAISGLHISLIAGMVFFAVRWSWSRLGRWNLRHPAQHAGAIAAIGAASMYAALAGFSVPTQRALIMVAVVMLALLLKRGRAISHTLMTALLFVLIYDPFAVMDGGFWLSFCAVATILFGMGQRLAAAGWWWNWGRLHLLVTIGLTPVLLALFQQLPLASPLANFIAVPWVNVGVVPLVLCGSLLIAVVPALGEPILHLAELMLAVLWPLLEMVARVDVLQWTQHAPQGWTVIAAAIGVVFLLAPRGIPGRWLGMLWLLPAFIIVPARPVDGEFRLALLDVGQGLAAVVQTRGHALVFDTGARFNPDFDAGAAVLIPYLRHHGIKSIDTLVISHADNDHIGGAGSLAGSMGVKRVLSSVPERIPWWSAERCVEGASWQWDGVRFEILHPASDTDFSGNNASCVLLIDNAGGRALLTGDIEARAEAALVRKHATRLSAQILVAPHHGSKTSSTAAFIAMVGPDYALFPSGYRNRWAFPHREVVDRYRAIGAQIYSSADHGAITFDVPAAGALGDPVTYRQFRARYWHDR